MVDLTGGRSFFPSDVDDLDGIYEEISAELDGRYALGYVSKNTKFDGRWRKIEIKLDKNRSDLENIVVRNREGYYAPFLEDQP